MVCIAAGGLLFNIIMNRVLAYNPVVNSMDDGMGAITSSIKLLNKIPNAP